MSQKKTISIKVAGAAGQGVESSGSGFVKILKNAGLHVFGLSDFMSLIKGGHNFFQITISDQPVYSQTEQYHVVVCFDPQNVKENIAHIKELHTGGIFIVDEKAKLDDLYESTCQEYNANLIRVPLSDLAETIGGNKIMANTVAMSAVLSCIGLPLDHMNRVIEANFSRKGQEVVDKNLAVAKAGYDFISENHPGIFKYELPAMDPSKTAHKMLMHGNDAIAMGSYMAGCRFISAYPMTPGTSVFEWFTKRNAKLGVVTKHVEDEIASICMAVGAGQVGARAMTTTSGGGFCLMVEALGLAGITEVGVVVVNSMRGGPSTGLPTRTEQPDLLFAINASHGEFPRAVLTPRTLEECYEAGVKAHNIAAKCQMPVIILTDTMLSGEIRDMDPADLKMPTIDMGEIVSYDELDKMQPKEYKRFKFTESGISPKALPGHPNAINAPATDEHDEYGQITEDAENRIKMMDKRMRKMNVAAEQIKGPEFYGSENADLTVIAWGSTYGPVREAVDLFNATNDNKINMLSYGEVWPFPTTATKEALAKTKYTVSVEQNFTSQLSKLIRQETCHQVNKEITKYDGLPFNPEALVRELQEVLKQALVSA